MHARLLRDRGEFTHRTHGVLLEPRVDARRVELVEARQRAEAIARRIRLEADGARARLAARARARVVRGERVRRQPLDVGRRRVLADRTRLLGAVNSPQCDGSHK